ncbi:MAG: myosin-crossreactive antigen [Granulosicoccus sp.]|jgi:myosin-crossreactive antigen
MPYITSMFMPRSKSDRPLPVPKNSKHLAFISQFVEIPDDVVLTVEYSVRAAQMAVYELLKIELAIPPVTKSTSCQIKHSQSQTKLSCLLMCVAVQLKICLHCFLRRGGEVAQWRAQTVCHEHSVDA